MHPLGRTLDEYRRAVESFRWEIPTRFNFGRDVVDRWAEAPERPALLWRDAVAGGALGAVTQAFPPPAIAAKIPAGARNR